MSEDGDGLKGSRHFCFRRRRCVSQQASAKMRLVARLAVAQTSLEAEAEPLNFGCRLCEKAGRMHAYIRLQYTMQPATAVAKWMGSCNRYLEHGLSCFR